MFASALKLNLPAVGTEEQKAQAEVRAVFPN
jgi:hypothetical protein